MPALPSEREMQRAYKTSDESYDGIFYLGVRTTGVFCRPSCGARKPLPRNVEYFSSPREAIFAGYRPCKRCQPLRAAGSPPGWVRTLLDRIDQDPAARLSDSGVRQLGVDPARARRYFQRQYGMTFQAYCRGRRLGQALEQIRTGARIDDVALGQGYGSHSGFRDAFTRVFRTPPGQARHTEAITVSGITSPLGPLLAAATAQALVLLEFTERRMLEEQFRTLRRYFRLPIVPGENAVIALLKKELNEYFRATRTKFTVPILFPGSEFQQKVWKALLSVPYGRTLSYQDLSLRVGSPRAQRAVGHVNGLNRIAIVIPCHRIVNKSGALGGYGGGVWRKRALLDLEQGKLDGSNPVPELRPAKKLPSRISDQIVSRS